jgi:hypothetical protein
MKRSALFAAVALLALAACSSSKSNGSGSGKSTTSSSSSTSTSPKRTKGSVKAVTIARRLGCTKPRLLATHPRVGLPSPIAIVTCVAKDVRYRVEVYANHADRVRLLNAASTKLRCRTLKALGGKGPIYTVNGADFSAVASAVSGTNDAAAQAKALGVKLSLPVTTTTCPA